MFTYHQRCPIAFFRKQFSISNANPSKIQILILGLEMTWTSIFIGPVLLQDLTNLSQLSSLRELGLKSPEYCSSPVGHLCNYSTHLLYHLPQLTYLDKQDVNSRPLQDVIKVRFSLISINACVHRMLLSYHINLVDRWRIKYHSPVYNFALQLQNFVACGRACPSHMPQNFVPVGQICR